MQNILIMLSTLLLICFISDPHETLLCIISLRYFIEIKFLFFVSEYASKLITRYSKKIMRCIHILYLVSDRFDQIEKEIKHR